MLAAWPHVTGNQVILRPSMQKFESPHLKLGAMKVRSFLPRPSSSSLEADPLIFLRWPSSLLFILIVKSS